MATFRITGGTKLEGVIPIMGAKNAATPIVAATLLSEEECIIENVPVITDVLNLLALMESLGAQVERDGHTVRIRASSLNHQALDRNLVKSMRSSILLLGPLLARLGEVRLPMPGGCIIGNRPIDAHLSALEQLGAIVEEGGEEVWINGKGLHPGVVILPEFSVTATENVLMAAASLSGSTTIKMAAAEPHVQDLCAFLVRLGATITGIGTHTLTVTGTKHFLGAQHRIIPDVSEIGTFMVAAAVTRGRVSFPDILPEHLDAVLDVSRRIGIDWNLKENTLHVHQQSPLRSLKKLQALPYPGFPTDLQAPFAVLATQATGTSLIHDPLYEGRMGYVHELIKMGANAVICDPHRVVISGPTPLFGTEIKSLDLRAGATLVLAALAARGETVISDAQLIDRGYERIEERLAAVGAAIRREEGTP